ncbi:unnamed protein product, partial [Scytosiphon promiscuus]
MTAWCSRAPTSSCSPPIPWAGLPCSVSMRSMSSRPSQTSTSLAQPATFAARMWVLTAADLSHHLVLAFLLGPPENPSSTKACATHPLNLKPTCEGTAGGSALCLVKGGLRITVDGREEVQGAGEYHFDGGIHITAVNLPLECQRFGDFLMWGNLDEEEKQRSGSRSLRSAGTTTSIFEWLLADSVMIAPPWCVKYLDELHGDVNALTGIQSNHAVLRIESPNLSLRVNVGINTEQEQTLQDGRVVPSASFWQMDVRVEHAEGISIARGML